MKERKGPFGLMVGGIVDTVVQGARRRAQDREPRALVYDPSGQPRLVPSDAPGREALVTAAASLIELAGAGGREADGAEAAAAEAAAADAVTDLGDARAVSAVEPDPAEAVDDPDAELVTDAEVVTEEDIATSEDVTTAADAVTDADVVAPAEDDDPPPETT